METVINKKGEEVKRSVRIKQKKETFFAYVINVVDKMIDSFKLKYDDINKRLEHTKEDMGEGKRYYIHIYDKKDNKRINGCTLLLDYAQGQRMLALDVYLFHGILNSIYAELRHEFEKN